MNDPKLLWAPHAWLDGWRDRVLLRVENGHWREVTPDVPAPAGAKILNGPALPGMVNAHSHAFQRAFAGLAEHRSADQDDFWTWRDRMYGLAMKITPEQLRAVATQLYVELLRGGYTHVVEFHYLHTQTDGKPYPDPLTLSHALIAAAADAGIGLTMAPVVYERAGFERPVLRHDQIRFSQSAEQVWQAYQSLPRSTTINAAIGIHSLRAASSQSLEKLLHLAKDADIPFHIHCAEQTGEVDACLAATGKRPIEWLAAEHRLDPRWMLTHATHTTPAELDAVAKSGAGIIVCPNTEGNLGDGFCDAEGILARDIPLAVGSDSQIARAWPDELRLYEYAQRLRHRRRCLSADPDRGRPSSGERLVSLSLAGGAKAAGFKTWGFQPGARADLLVLDRGDAALSGVPMADLLDAVVFSTPSQPWSNVMVAGKWTAHDPSAIQQRFTTAMTDLWGTSQVV